MKSHLDRRGLVWGGVGVAVLLAFTILGSDQLVWFDAALIGYLFGLIFATFAIIYRYSVWLRRPPTAMLNRRGWDAFRAGRLRNAAALPALVGTHLLAQGFIRRRSRSRWLAHQLVFWGCILAGLVTVPLTLGLLHFQSVGQDAERYQVYFSKIGTLSFNAESVLGWVIFHALDIAAVLVLAGVFIFLRRRLRDPGAIAVERSGDFLALAGLFAVSVTGLFLTVSSTFLEGRYYSALNTIHALTVILGLMYIPFGKLFHIFQRPANLGVQFYKRANADDRLAPFLEGMVILAWATATFWFPVMIAIGIWRHLIKRVPLRYHPAYWALVFPIGMYGAATYKMIAVTGLNDLDLLPQLALAMALIAWTAAFAGLVATLIRSASPARRAT